MCQNPVSMETSQPKYTELPQYHIKSSNPDVINNALYSQIKKGSCDIQTFVMIFGEFRFLSG